MSTLQACVVCLYPTYKGLRAYYYGCRSWVNFQVKCPKIIQRPMKVKRWSQQDAWYLILHSSKENEQKYPYKDPEVVFCPSSVCQTNDICIFPKIILKMIPEIHHFKIQQTLNVTMKTWRKESDFFIFILSKQAKIIPNQSAYSHTYTVIQPPTYSFIKGNRPYWKKDITFFCNTWSEFSSPIQWKVRLIKGQHSLSLRGWSEDIIIGI